MDAEIQAMDGKPQFSNNPRLSTNQIFPQIPPFWIGLFNQRYLGMALPFLDILFAKNSTFHVFVLLIPYQGMNPITLCESFHKIVSMLIYPLRDWK